MTQNAHVRTICCRPEAVYDVISGRNVKTVEGYLVVNFMTATEAAAADIGDSIKRKRIRVSLNNLLKRS